METNTLGSVLKYYRDKYNLSQEDICNGVCTTTVLSQIENGKKIVDSLISETLLGRIGKTVLQFELLLNENDYELWNLREQIKEAEKNADYIQMKLLLEIYSDKMPEKNVHKQFYMFENIKCKIIEGETNAEIGRLLYETLQITRPQWNCKNTQLLSPIEIEIILLMYKFQGIIYNDEEIENSLLRIMILIKDIYSESLKQDVGNRVIMDLIEYKTKQADYVCAIKYIDEAIELCSNGRSVKNIAELHFLKGKMIKNIYKKSKSWTEELRRCKKECLMAYYVFEIMEQEEKCMQVRKFCEEDLEWQIIE